MGHYAYKDVIHEIPKRYFDENFKKNHGRECDCDPGYDGDYWIATSDYIEDLKEVLINVKKAINPQCPRSMHEWKQMLDAANNEIDKVLAL